MSGNTIDDTLKASLLHENGYATAKVLQQQNAFGGGTRTLIILRLNRNHNANPIEEQRPKQDELSTGQHFKPEPYEF